MGNDHLAFQDTGVLRQLGLGDGVADEISSGAFSTPTPNNSTHFNGIHVAQEAQLCAEERRQQAQQKADSKPFSKSATMASLRPHFNHALQFARGKPEKVWKSGSN